ncbi:MAG TPA: hypothetical protein VMU95_16260 [Trebonia sp.]|nr:hypothetical protein [Trebonia sp.]
MTPKPMPAQFSRACGQFVRPTGFPRPFGSLDWCPRCGQPDWAHQADRDHRRIRLSQLDPRRMSDMLRYLCEYAPAAFDVIDDAVRAAEDRRAHGQQTEAGQTEAQEAEAQQAESPEEPFCLSCGAALAVFPADGLYYRHYRETSDGDCLRFSVEHPTVLGWRPLADI